MKKSSTFVNFNFLSNQQQILSAGNICRWKPALAIEWMEEVVNKIVSPVEIEFWNKIAKEINRTLDSIESTRYYSKETFWGTMVPKRLSQLEKLLTLEDYVLYQQYIK